MASSRALPDLIARIKIDSSGVDAAMNDLVNSFGKAKLGMAAVAGIAAGAGIAIVAAAQKSIESYIALGEQVENYKRVVGGSAEESSRMVSVFNALGVGSDAATGAMFKLSKAIELTPKKLTDLGVVIATDAQGNIDLARTLLSVADAYNAATEQTQKNLIVFDAFGKTGRDMIPILERGSAALRDLEAAASIVYSDADLARIKEYKVQTAELQQAQDALGQSIGGVLLPIRLADVEATNATIYAERKLDEAVANGTITAAQRVSGGAKLLQQYQDEFLAQQRGQHVIDLATQSIKDQAAANDLLTKSFDALLKSQDAELSAQDKVVSETARAKESQDKITESQIRANVAARAVADAQTQLNIAARDYGPNSKQAGLAQENLTTLQIQARAANDAVTQAIQDQKDAYIGLARAQLDAFITQETANGGVRNSTAEQKLLIAQLDQEAKTLAPGSPLRLYLEQYIKTLKSDMPSDVFTTIHARIVNDSGSTKTVGGTKAFAEGGRPPVGVPSWVGERGRELFVPDQPGTIIPHGATTGTINYNLTLNGSSAVNDPDAVRSMLNRMQLLGAAG